MPSESRKARPKISYIGGKIICSAFKMDCMELYPFDLSLSKYPENGLLEFSLPDHLEGQRRREVQFWFRAGVTWMYAFNHEEAIECFKRCLNIDDSLAMAHWGVSCCHGPNYNTVAMNKEVFPSARDAYFHALEAKRHSASSQYYLSQVEVSLINALQNRYNPVDKIDDGTPVDQNTKLYADSLRQVYESFSDVPCVACLFAEALLNFRPWKLWDLDTGELLVTI